jgi:hypothetical protein
VNSASELLGDRVIMSIKFSKLNDRVSASFDDFAMLMIFKEGHQIQSPDRRVWTLDAPLANRLQSTA